MSEVLLDDNRDNTNADNKKGARKNDVTASNRTPAIKHEENAAVAGDSKDDRGKRASLKIASENDYGKVAGAAGIDGVHDDNIDRRNQFWSDVHASFVDDDYRIPDLPVDHPYMNEDQHNYGDGGRLGGILVCRSKWATPAMLFYWYRGLHNAVVSCARNQTKFGRYREQDCWVDLEAFNELTEYYCLGYPFEVRKLAVLISWRCGQGNSLPPFFSRKIPRARCPSSTASDRGASDDDENGNESENDRWTASDDYSGTSEEDVPAVESRKGGGMKRFRKKERAKKVDNDRSDGDDDGMPSTKVVDALSLLADKKVADSTECRLYYKAKKEALKAKRECDRAREQYEDDIHGVRMRHRQVDMARKLLEASSLFTGNRAKKMKYASKKLVDDVMDASGVFFNEVFGPGDDDSSSSDDDGNNGNHASANN